MPRFLYWTILLGDQPTAFRARERDDLVPTLKQLQRQHPEAVLRWYERGRLWDSPEAARAQLEAQRRAKELERRDRKWRPGGEHRDPHERDRPPRDVRRRKLLQRLRERGEIPGPSRGPQGAPPFQRPQGAPPARPPGDRGPAPGRGGPGAARGPKGPGFSRGPGGARPSSGPKSGPSWRGPRGGGFSRGPGGTGPAREPKSERPPRGPAGPGRPRRPGGTGSPRGPKGGRGGGR